MDEVERDATAVLLAGFAGTDLSASLRRRLEAGLGGVVLFARNVEDPPQVRALTDAIRDARLDAVVAIDEEGGDVTRLHQREGSPEPGNGVLGRLDDEAATFGSARRIGRELAAAGCTLDFAPTADANTDPDNPVIGARSFGADPHLVARHTVAWIDGLRSAGVAACAKHFPGHGDTAVDSHLGLPVVVRDRAALAERELVPFVAAIRAGVAAIMTSHILLPHLDPDAPATLSRAVLTGLLREELGFDGVIVTDALDMAGASGGIGIPAAAVRSLAAGADLLCLGSDSEPHLDAVIAAIVRAVETGELTAERVREAAARVQALPRAAVRFDRAPPERPADAVIATAFDARPGAAAALAEALPWTVVRLASEPNVAVGRGEWGPFAALESPGGRRFAGWRRIDVPLDRADPPAVDGRVLVIGRDVHRRPAARAVVDGLRARGGTVVVVDMGWPSPDRRYADLATFGASAAVGAALLDLIERSAPWRS